MVLCLPFSTSDQHDSLGWNHLLIGPWLASQDGARKHNTQFSRKERSVSLNFPGHLHQTAVRQPIHLGSFDLEKYLQQTFSVAKKSTDLKKNFFFFCSIPEWKEPRMKCHIIGFSGSVMIWPGWIDSCVLHLQGPGGILCEWTCLTSADFLCLETEGIRRLLADSCFNPQGSPPYTHLRAAWLTFCHLLLYICMT